MSELYLNCVTVNSTANAQRVAAVEQCFGAAGQPLRWVMMMMIVMMIMMMMIMMMMMMMMTVTQLAGARAGGGGGAH